MGNIKEEDFVNEFIDNVLNSEFIVMIEDDVTITQTVTTTTTVEADGTYTTEVPEVTISETVRDKIELTYADTWFVTVSKDFSFSTATLQSATNRGVMLRGSRGDLLGSFRVTGYCPCEECSNSYGTGTSTGATCTANRTIAVDPNVLPYGTKVIIEGLEPNIYVAEDCGGAVDRKSYRCLC